MQRLFQLQEQLLNLTPMKIVRQCASKILCESGGGILCIFAVGQSDCKDTAFNSQNTGVRQKLCKNNAPEGAK